MTAKQFKAIESELKRLLKQSIRLLARIEEIKDKVLARPAVRSQSHQVTRRARTVKRVTRKPKLQ